MKQFTYTSRRTGAAKLLDPNSETWGAVTLYLNDEIETLRAQLETAGLDAPATEALRGRIGMARAILAMPNTVHPTPFRADQTQRDNYTS